MRQRQLWAITLVLAALAGLSCGSSTSTSVTAPTTPRCQVTATASPSSFAASGGTGSVSVTTTRDCTWSATAGVSWVALGGSSSGQGSASFDFSVSANTDPAARSGTIDVNGQKVSISEQPAPCQYVVSPAALNVASAGGTFSLTVQAQSACSWTVASSDPWIAVRTASGSGSATVQVVIGVNTAAQRTGTITIAGQAITVTQSNGIAAPPPPPPPPPPGCSYTIAPTSQSFTAAGGTGSIDLATTGACPWTVTSNAAWIAITAATSGSGSASVTYSVAANPDSARSGTLTIAGQTFTVTEDGAAAPPPPPPPACTYTVSPGNQRIDANGGNVTFSVSTTSSCAWTAVPNDSWLVVASGAAGTGNGSVVVGVQPNSGGSRNGTLTIAGQSVGVKQGGADANLSGPVAALAGACPALRFEISTSRVATDASTTFMKGPCKNVQDGVTVSVLGTVQSDLSVLATELTLLKD